MVMSVSVSLNSIVRLLTMQAEFSNGMTRSRYASNHLNDVSRKIAGYAENHGYFDSDSLQLKEKELDEICVAIFAKLQSYKRGGWKFDDEFEVSCKMNGADQTLVFRQGKPEVEMWLKEEPNKTVFLSNIKDHAGLLAQLSTEYESDDDDIFSYELLSDGQRNPYVEQFGYRAGGSEESETFSYDIESSSDEERNAMAIDTSPVSSLSGGEYSIGTLMFAKLFLPSNSTSEEKNSISRATSRSNVSEGRDSMSIERSGSRGSISDKKESMPIEIPSSSGSRSGDKDSMSLATLPSRNNSISGISSSMSRSSSRSSIGEGNDSMSIDSTSSYEGVVPLDFLRVYMGT